MADPLSPPTISPDEVGTAPTPDINAAVPVATCDRCGSPMFERSCKLVCRNCGSRMDCSDLTIYMD